MGKIKKQKKKAKLCVKIELATTIYNRIERNRNENIDVVLASAMSFDTLKSAYPKLFRRY